MRKQHYDVIGDIHGAYRQLKQMLTHLGYVRPNGRWTHPAGRKLAFLGDFIDPKYDGDHDVPAVLETVKCLCDDGIAVAVMGNHEYNAVCYATKGHDGEWLRPHNERNARQVRMTLDRFDGGFESAAWQGWVDWFRTLPMALDLGGMRMVHACWHEEMLGRLNGQTLEDHEFLVRSATRGHDDYEAVEVVLKGIELPIANGASYVDHTGTERFNFRVKWFDTEPAGRTCRDLAFPSGVFDVPDEPITDDMLGDVIGYDSAAVPVFIGHYFKPTDSALSPDSTNLACLDHSVAKGGPLICYRWSGETTLKPENYVAA
ncbi:metallophosphoesterase [Sulfuriroseicoccus oceanibius]|uniref:Calcineurin-like phosphoesterase domain-containing protein n=1 Tax=Sulfuriroseicoccus oceanibius TaxID=2707525 RepID=A0A6B3L303_9BACT|nr:metallophosphoesterase [Sulfuriroseicoccus oceanibius]QQL45335.1 hypothetical protein G3M56_001730 [Sulfuriroseicoccus oceanibius]